MAQELTENLVQLLEEWETLPRPRAGEARQRPRAGEARRRPRAGGARPRARRTRAGVALVSLLTKIAEVLESATEIYLKKDPDPFEEQHPSRVHPDAELGHMLKKVIEKENFIAAVFREYLSNTADLDTQIVACRILFDLLPGIDSKVFWDNFNWNSKLLLWAQSSPHSDNPLRSYALGVLATTMKDRDTADLNEYENAELVPIVFKRLKDLSDRYFQIQNNGPNESSSQERQLSHLIEESKDWNQPGCSSEAANSSSESRKIEHQCLPASLKGKSGECSTSSWSEMASLIIGPYQVYPLTLADEQRYIIQYLTSVGAYQELQTDIFEGPAVIWNLLLRYSDLKEHSNVRLAFDALRYMGVLLGNKKRAVDFICDFGVHHLLLVPRPSLAATGVSFILYKLGRNMDAMRKICNEPHQVVCDLVNYALWLLECSHSSGRTHATKFFKYALQFEIIRLIFDEQDGLRKLVNTVNLLDDVATSKHVYWAILALKKYFEYHVDCKAAELRLSHGTSSIRSGAYNNSLAENVEVLVDSMRPPVLWEPIEHLLKLDGIHLLLRLIIMHHERKYPKNFRMETVRNALDILFMCSVSDNVKLELCKSYHATTSEDTIQKFGMTIILECCAEEKFPDSNVHRSALNVIVNCIRGPVHSIKDTPVTDNIQPSMETGFSLANEEVMHKVRDTISCTDGIMVLQMLLTSKEPVVGADAIRALACQALCGLAGSEKVRLIISKLQLFTSDQLQVLMREPILKDKPEEHAKFVKYCSKLIELMTGTSMANISKAEIVAQTVIRYDRKQLFQVVVKYLQTEGMNASAAALIQEAKLDSSTSEAGASIGSSIMTEKLDLRPKSNQESHIVSHKSLCLKPAVVEFPAAPAVSKPENSDLVIYTPEDSTSECNLPKDDLESRISTSHKLLLSENVSSTGKRFQAAPTSVLDKASDMPPPAKKLAIESKDPASLSSTVEMSAGPSVPFKSFNTGPFTSNVLNAASTRRTLAAKPRKLANLQKQAITNASSSTRLVSYSQPMFMEKQAWSQDSQAATNHPVTLDFIVTEYLRSQHALCETPYVTCPPFDLFKRHHCPEPCYKNDVSENISFKFMQKQFTPSSWGHRGASMTKKYLSRRFREVNPISSSDYQPMTKCAFSALGGKIYVGSCIGYLKVFETLSGQEVRSFPCHKTEITNIQVLRNTNLFLTSAERRRSPVTSLWDASRNHYRLKHKLYDECYAEFSKLTYDRVIATKYKRAQIYDLTSGQMIGTLNTRQVDNSNQLNRATFNYTDEMVLSDGIVWDAHNFEPIHTLDMLNSNRNGVFHPNGLEIISNSKVWDVRTYRIIRTVPQLEENKLIFDHTGDVIYGAIIASEIDKDSPCFKSNAMSFWAFDSSDYACIATKDVQQGILDIDVSPDDTHLCVIQSALTKYFYLGSNCKCHVYEIGRGYEDDDDVDGPSEDHDDDDNNDDQETDDTEEDNDDQEIDVTEEDDDDQESDVTELEDDDQESDVTEPEDDDQESDDTEEDDDGYNAADDRTELSEDESDDED